MQYRDSLDGLRAVCIIFTIFNHIPFVPSYIDGSFGVDIFFALSGWLITWLLLKGYEKDQCLNLRSFYIRRFFRIVPLYMLTILIYAVASILVAKMGQHEKLESLQASFPYLLSFNSEFRPLEAGDSMLHAWTLGIEEKFYIIWPLLLLLCIKKPPLALALCTALVSSIILATQGDGLFIRGYCGLAFGAVLAIFVDWKPQLKSLLATKHLGSAIACSFIGIYLLSFIFPHGYNWNVLVSFLGAGLVANLWLNSETKTSKALSNSFLAWAGKLTFAIYLIHVLVINVVEIVIQKVGVDSSVIVTFALSYALSIVVAYILHISVEKPLIELGRKLAKGRIVQSGFSPRV